MQKRLVQNFTFILEWGQETCSFRKHTRRWAYSGFFSLYAACSALRHFFLMAQTYVIPTFVMVLGKISQSDVSFDNFAHCTERRTYHNDDIFLSLIFHFSYLLARGTRINPTFVFVQYNISLLVVYLLVVGCGWI